MGLSNCAGSGETCRVHDNMMKRVKFFATRPYVSQHKSADHPTCFPPFQISCGMLAPGFKRPSSTIVSSQAVDAEHGLLGAFAIIIERLMVRKRRTFLAMKLRKSLVGLLCPLHRAQTMILK